MTDKQRRFAEEYARTMDQRGAYKAAYPYVRRDASADVNASKLLSDAKYKDVQDYVAELMARATDDAVADAHETLAYLTSVMRGKSEAEVVMTVGLGEGVSGVEHVSKHPDERERLKAAELLAKYHQLLVPRVQLETEHSGGVIVLQEATDGEP